MSNNTKSLLLDTAVVLGFTLLVSATLGLQMMWSANLPTGGDVASHLLYAWLYSHELLPHGQVTAWMPEVFAGLPFLSYYFPLPFIVIALLSSILPFGIAMKNGMFLAAMLLPGAVWIGGVRLLAIPRAVAIWAALAVTGFIFHEQNSIWGGNLLSTLAGEFAYSYGMFFSTLTLMAWLRVIQSGRGWWLAALLEAATGFSHGFALLLTGFATSAFLFERQHFLRNLRLLALGHGLAFFLLAGWLWPMLEMHQYTIPNDALFEIDNWRDFFPASLWPVLAAGLTGLLGWTALRRLFAARIDLSAEKNVTCTLYAAGFFAMSALLAAVGFVLGGWIGLADIRFFPFVWLFGAIACGLGFGLFWHQVSLRLASLSRAGWHLLSLAATLAFMVWVGQNIKAAPDWGLWNHSGLETKPQWQQLQHLFPVLSGRMDNPRLLFEHDPDNNDLGSTRTLEALPMFLGGRPVLEGLYMESALISPAIYQLQSEVSARPSSPLARFPSASLDPEMAAAHMQFLFANEVLLRSNIARQALASSAEFELAAEILPFSVYRLKNFSPHLVDLVDRPIRWLPRAGWMEESYRWFRSRERFPRELPVFNDTDEIPAIRPAPAQTKITNLQMSRAQITWHTEAPGAAHLLRVSWHPRWRLASRGKLYLAAPGFMLVVPEEAEVRLEYGHTQLGWTAMAFTLLATICLFLLIRQRSASQVASAPPRHPWRKEVMLWPLLLIAVGLWGISHNSKGLYTKAWTLARANRPAEAATAFQRAFKHRRSEAQREEALFWAAKSWEQAQRPDLALPLYRLLVADYHGYWLPESLYTLANLTEAKAEADTARQRLLKEFPKDRWAQQMITESKHK